MGHLISRRLGTQTPSGICVPGIAILGYMTPRAAAFILLAFCMRCELPEIYRRLTSYGSAVERLVMAGQHEDSYREGLRTQCDSFPKRRPDFVELPIRRTVLG